MSMFNYMKDSYLPTVFKEESFKCDCCNELRNLKYVGPMYYAGDDAPALCLECIRSGEAVKKGLVSSFNDIEPEGITEVVSEEICFRTPGIFTWQDQSWATHCHDACDYFGDATVQDVKNADEKAISLWMQRYGMDRSDWDWSLGQYTPDGDQGVYKFVCRHCSAVVFNWDFS
ncbi:hypothetical protein D8Z03_25380 [Salmonella enterica]|nr:hypothetical protein [Salmonella enterica subsp. diarizonae serovar 17:z10:e,n,x,z15]